jgi:hypothetical protein
MGFIAVKNFDCRKTQDAFGVLLEYAGITVKYSTFIKYITAINVIKLIKT